MTLLFPTSLPNGQFLWYGTALPSQAGDGTFTAGDYFWVVTSAAGPGTLYRCTTTGNGATAIFQPATGLAANVNFQTAAYTPTVLDDVVIVSANVAVNLPPAVNLPNAILVVKNTNASGGTVVASSGIDGGHTVTLVQNASIQLVVGTNPVTGSSQYYAIAAFGSSAIS